LSSPPPHLRLRAPRGFACRLSAAVDGGCRRGDAPPARPQRQASRRREARVVIASQAVRLVSASPRRPGRTSPVRPVRATARGVPRVLAGPLTGPRQGHGRAGDAPLRREARPRAITLRAPAVVRSASWDLRIFGLAIAAIILAFGLAL